MWKDPKIQSSVRKPGSYGSMREKFAKARIQEQEQDAANEYLKKAQVPMSTLLDMRLQERQPLIVMRPLSYVTSVMNTEDEDDGFYNMSKSSAPKFVDKRVTVLPGTQLLIKALDPHLQEFIFEDGTGKEHAISFAYRNALLTQTDIWETTQKYFEGK